LSEICLYNRCFGLIQEISKSVKICLNETIPAIHNSR